MPKFSVFFELSPATKTNPRPDIVEHIEQADDWTLAVKQIAEREGYNALQYRSCCEHITSEQTLWNGTQLSQHGAEAYNSLWRTIKRYQAEGLTAPANLYDEAHRVIAETGVRPKSERAA